MGTHNLFFLKTHFDLLYTCFLDEFLCEKMIWFVRSLRIILFDYVFYAFGVIIRNIPRFHDDGANNEEDFRLLKSSSGSENGGFGEEGGGATENLVMNSIPPTTSKHQFISGREVDGFIEELDSIGWIMQQFFADNYYSNACRVQINEVPPDESSGEFASVVAEEEEVLEKEGQEVLSEHGHGDSEEEDELGSANNKNEILAAGDFREADFEREAMDEEKWDYFVERLGTEEKIKPEIESKNEKDYLFFTNSDVLPEIQAVGDDYSIPSDADSDSMNSTDEGFTTSNHEVIAETEETFPDRESNLGSEFCYSDDDFIELELQINDSVPALAEHLPLKDPQKLEEDNDTGNSVQEETHRREEPSVMSFNEEDELGTAPEHEDLIEQLKSELRNLRTGGLPTIWEDGSEPESPLTTDRNLKPLKINQKYDQKDQMEESQEVYKPYEDKMRKLDILNDQTMNASGILQLKTQNLLIWRQKSPIPAIKPLISHTFWPRKSQKSVADSSLKSTGDLHKELELVYVGQICLSWEIMYWQHRKVLQLQEHESKGLGQYVFNQVADDFQTFQILMDRFVENDKFHGSRVENYVRNRCIMRKFLQVPTIKGDCLKDKNVAKNKEGINCGMLAQVIEESIRAFHDFICADKDEQKQTQTDLEDPADSTLFDDTKAALQKKEKKLKEIWRSRNCIVKKLKKKKKERVNYTLVVAQVELKVVGRALRMSRLSKSQLHWCSQKLNQVSFFRGKVKLEPSFLLFPC